MPFQVLFVCTANICRSVMAEQLFTAAIGANPDVGVASAGMRALRTHDMDGDSAAAIAELGVTPRPHTARQLEPAMVEGSRLVLTATTDHRADVVRLVPMAFRRVFTMREFARLGAGLPPATDTSETGLRARVAEVAGERGLVDPPGPGADEVGDPYRKPFPEMQLAAVTIRDAVRDTARILGL